MGTFVACSPGETKTDPELAVAETHRSQPAYRYSEEEPCGVAEREVVAGTLQDNPNAAALVMACIGEEEGQGALLLQAMSYDRMPTFKWLLEQGADPFSELLIAAGSSQLRRLIGFAMMHDDAKWTAAILESGTDPNSIYEDRGRLFTLLEFAAKYGKRDTTIVSTILDHGADVNLLSEDGRSVLGSAAKMLRYELCLFLLQRGASPTADSSADQPFMTLIEADKQNVMKRDDDEGKTAYLKIIDMLD